MTLPLRIHHMTIATEMIKVVGYQALVHIMNLQ